MQILAYPNPHFDSTIRPISIASRHQSKMEKNRQFSCVFRSTQHFNVLLWYVPDPNLAYDFLFAICAANVYHRNALFVDAAAYPFFKFRQIFAIKIEQISGKWNFFRRKGILLRRKCDCV